MHLWTAKWFLQVWYIWKWSRYDSYFIQRRKQSILGVRPCLTKRSGTNFKSKILKLDLSTKWWVARWVAGQMSQSFRWYVLYHEHWSCTNLSTEWKMLQYAEKFRMWSGTWNCAWMWSYSNKVIFSWKASVLTLHVLTKKF